MQTLTLTAVPTKVYNQNDQNPCIFSNPACSPGPVGFGATALPTGGNETSYDFLSPVYTGSQLLTILNGASMLIGIDINQNGNAQTLTSFTMIKNTVVVDTFTGSTGNVPDQSNGNGWADFVLGNFSSFVAGDSIQFHFVFNNANDGTENVFLISGPTAATPEPVTLALTGSGLLGLFFLRKRFAKR